MPPPRPPEAPGAPRDEVVVTPEESDQRLDRLLAARFPRHSRSYLQRLIREGHVVLDGRRLKSGRCLRAGDRVVVEFPPPRPSGLEPAPLPLDVLFEDEVLIVVDKPAGLVVHPGAGATGATLVHALLHHCPRLSGIGGVERPGIVHRLDKDTSGVLVVAKDDEAHRSLSRQFMDRSVEKLYQALVWGRVGPQTGTITVPIGRDARRRTRISSRSARPREASTSYRVLARHGGSPGRPESFTWIEVRPRTGRTHQIRVHFKSLGHPVVGDVAYGGAGWKQVADPALREVLRGFRRLALHARRLVFTHPTTGRRMDLEAPLPAAIRSLLEAL